MACFLCAAENASVTKISPSEASSLEKAGSQSSSSGRNLVFSSIKISPLFSFLTSSLT